jgi:uncharacterized membrane protein YedE/YeeE
MTEKEIKALIVGILIGVILTILLGLITFAAGHSACLDLTEADYCEHVWVGRE